jgi:hypothetical protein
MDVTCRIIAAGNAALAGERKQPCPPGASRPARIYPLSHTRLPRSGHIQPKVTRAISLRTEPGRAYVQAQWCRLLAHVHAALRRRNMLGDSMNLDVTTGVAQKRATRHLRRPRVLCDDTGKPLTRKMIQVVMRRAARRRTSNREFTSCATRSVRTWRCAAHRRGPSRNSRGIRISERRSATCTSARLLWMRRSGCWRIPRKAAGQTVEK